MTIGVETSQQDWVGNGVTVDFPPAFVCQQPSDLTVKQIVAGVVSTLVFGVGYAVIGDVTVVGYIVRAMVAPAVAAVFHVERNVPITQTTSLRTQGTFNPKLHEDAFDKRTFVEQQLARRLAVVEAAVVGGITPPPLSSAYVSTTFTTDAVAVENTFPLVVAVPGVTARGVWNGRIINNTDGTARFNEAVHVSDWTPGVSNVSLNYISGLAPGTNYTLTLLVVF